MLEWVTESIATLGYPGIVFMMFLENLIPPIPSEVIMPLAGFGVARGHFSYFGAVAAGTLGSVLGTIPFYFLGRCVSLESLKHWTTRHGRWFLVTPADIDRVNQWFERHGPKIVLVGRCIPGLRSLISIPAGMHRMNFFSFTVYSAVGTALWVAGLAYLGVLLEEHYELVNRYLGPAGYVILGTSVLAFLIYAVRRKRLCKRSNSCPP